MIGRLYSFVVAGVFLIAGTAFAEESGYAWRAAVAKADITPKESMWMAGYAARKGPSEGVKQPIFVKVCTIEDAEENRLVIVTMDLIGVPRPFRDSVEALAKEKHGIAPANLLINASHTHSGPMIRVYRSPGKEGELRVAYANIPEEEQELRIRQTLDYMGMVTETIDDLIGETIASLEPVAISRSRSRCGFAMNRRTPRGPGSWRNFPNPDAPVDHEVPVLQIRSPDGEDLRVVLFGYACHATVLSGMEIHGDWPGYAQHFFEEDHPGTVAMFLNGCSGDQNPYPRRLDVYVERHGRSMATAIEAALDTAPHPVAGPIGAALAWPEVPYQDPPTREQLIERTKSNDRYTVRQADFLLSVLDKERGFPESYPVPVQCIAFGSDLLLTTIGGEVTIDYSLRLKKELRELTGGTEIWVAGYSNDVMTYIPSKRVLLEGGYEGGEAMRFVRSTVHPAPWDPSIEEILVGKIKELVGEVGYSSQ